MMELVDDVVIRCDRCNDSIFIQKSELDAEIDGQVIGEGNMGNFIEFSVYGETECPCCGNPISFRIYGIEYPEGGYNDHGSEITGGYFSEEPRMDVVYEEIFMGTSVQQLIIRLANDWDHIYDISSRDFEEVVAQVFEDNGFDVELTQATRDGGKDIVATTYKFGRPTVSFVECKKYGRDKTIGVNWVRNMLGVISQNRINKAYIVTSANFTRVAKREALNANTLIELIDGQELQDLIQKSAAQYDFY